MTEENCLLVFYDTELSKETITQVYIISNSESCSAYIYQMNEKYSFPPKVGAICEAGEFNR